MSTLRVPPYALIAGLFCCAGAFCEISFVKVAVQLASSDRVSSIHISEYIFAMCAPVLYMSFYVFFYLTSAKIATVKLAELLQLRSVAGSENDSKGALYKAISDDLVAVVEGFLFPTYLLLYRSVIVFTLNS